MHALLCNDGWYFSIRFKVYIMDVGLLDYVLVSKKIMSLVYASSIIIIKYPSNDFNYFSKIDIGLRP